MISDHMQDYLKAIWQLGAGGTEVSTSAIAERLEVSPASVTNMMKKLAELRHRSLAELPPAGQSGIVRRVSDHSPDQLRYLAELGLRPETEFTVLERAPFHGPIRLRLGEKEVSVGIELAQEIFVTGNK